MAAKVNKQDGNSRKQTRWLLKKTNKMATKENNQDGD